MAMMRGCQRPVWPKYVVTLLLVAVACLLLSARASASDNVSLQIARLKSPDPELRQYAADALGKFEDRRATEQLIETLRDSDPHVRMTAMVALAMLKDPPSRGPTRWTAAGFRRGHETGC
jgi:hypothetical protein